MPEENIQFCLDCQSTYDASDPDAKCSCIEPGVPPALWLAEDGDEDTTPDGGVTLVVHHEPFEGGLAGPAVFLRGPYRHALKLADLVARLAHAGPDDLQMLRGEAWKLHEAWQDAHPKCRSCGQAFIGSACRHCHVQVDPRTVVPILA